MACATPSLVLNWRLSFSSQPASSLSLRSSNFCLSQRLKRSQRVAPCCPLLAELGQHRRQDFLVRRGTARFGIAGVRDEFGERPQAFRGNLLAPLPKRARQQLAPGRFLQRREAAPGSAARCARCRYRLRGSRRARQASTARSAASSAPAPARRPRPNHRPDNSNQPLHGRTPRRCCSRSFRSCVGNDQHRQHERHAERAHHQVRHRTHGGDEEQVRAPQHRRQHGASTRPTSSVEHHHDAHRRENRSHHAPRDCPSEIAHCPGDRRERPETITPERRQCHDEQRRGPQQRHADHQQRLLRATCGLNIGPMTIQQQRRKAKRDDGRDAGRGPAPQRGGGLRRENSAVHPRDNESAAA